MFFHKSLLALLFGLCVILAHAELRDVVIMQTTDMHGVFDEEDGDGPSPGSWLRIATMAKRIRQREEGKCILIDCGDNAQGTLTTALSRGMAGIVPLKTMKYDVWVPGNHELDYGVERFGELTEAVNDIVLCGNLYIKGKEPFPAWRMIERNGVKVAVIGMTASYTKNWLLPDEYEKLHVEKAFETLERIMPQVHQAKPDVIVLAAHQAWFEGSDTRGVNEISKIAKSFPEIDVILGAHSHRLLPGQRLGRRSWYMQPGCHGEYLGVVRVTVDMDLHAVVAV
ncbi:MAG: bifunctional metallophosphatase/5'-nucleotidase, partial [Victivallales bacterium]|nr:bifunctional metallophosphatase/5'-nucleotidase [Victivallales bacterium]